MKNRQEDLADFDEAAPLVRSVLAFILLLRFGWPTGDCYNRADQFIETLHHDLGGTK